MMKRVIDGKTTISIEIEKSTTRLRSLESRLVNKHSGEIILDKKWMEKEEMKEKHLVAAITNKAAIPVPDIIEIDETIYDKLYPGDHKRTKWRIIAEPPNDDDHIEYDLDIEDDQWLHAQPKNLNLTPAKFETYFVFLEGNSKNKVPTFLDFLTYFKGHRPIEGLEKVYDYWLDKRLSMGGKQLIPKLKRAEKITAKNKFDPYIAFRPNRGKMLLRKNRNVDRENYVKMLRLRDQMVANVRMWKNFMIQKRVEHQHTTHKYNTFLEQYQKKNFCENYTSDKPLYNTEKIFSDMKTKTEVVSFIDDTPDVTFEDVQQMGFTVCAKNNFHKPINPSEMIFDVDRKQKFYCTENGFVRARVGRGGRIIMDRKITNKHSSEFQQFHVLGEFNLRKYEPPPPPNGSAASFKLSNSCSHKIDFETLIDQFYFEVE